MIYEWVTSLNSDTLERGVADHQELSMCVRTQMDHWHSPMRLGDKKSCSKSIFTIMQFSSLSHWHHWNIHECHQLHHLVELLNLSTTLPLHRLRESLKLKWNYIPIGGAQGRSCLCNRSARGTGSAHHCKLGSHLQYQRASTSLVRPPFVPIYSRRLQPTAQWTPHHLWTIPGRRKFGMVLIVWPWSARSDFQRKIMIEILSRIDGQWPQLGSWVLSNQNTPWFSPISRLSMCD